MGSLQGCAWQGSYPPKALPPDHSPIRSPGLLWLQRTSAPTKGAGSRVEP